MILAGGAGKRMGADKALVEVAGRPMVEIVAGALALVTGRVVVAGRELAGFESLPDPPGDRFRGPLAGLVAGLVAFDEPLVVVAVDQPWVRPATLAGLLDRLVDLPVVPVEEGVRQATCAVYPPGLASPATEELAAGGSLQSLLDRIAFEPILADEWRRWGEDGRSWFSVDHPAAIQWGLTRYGPPASVDPRRHP